MPSLASRSGMLSAVGIGGWVSGKDSGGPFGCYPNLGVDGVKLGFTLTSLPPLVSTWSGRISRTASIPILTSFT